MLMKSIQCNFGAGIGSWRTKNICGFDLGLAWPRTDLTLASKTTGLGRRKTRVGGFYTTAWPLAQVAGLQQ